MGHPHPLLLGPILNRYFVLAFLTSVESHLLKTEHLLASFRKISARRLDPLHFRNWPSSLSYSGTAAAARSDPTAQASWQEPPRRMAVCLGESVTNGSNRKERAA